jgi:nucleoside-diphosphate-sugar epimerase
MSKQTVLVTGANGEIGHALIAHLARNGDTQIVALDLQPLDDNLASLCDRMVVGDILDRPTLEALWNEHMFNSIYHMAAILSTSAERMPEKAHQVNVNGTASLLDLTLTQAREEERTVKFLYPSSKAAYGLPNLEEKARAGAVREEQWCRPTTMYGVNKLYGEHLGRYYADHYRQLDPEPAPGGIDFRAIRFPGLISAHTVPSGGTSDYVPEMLHHAAQGLPYTCFVREDTRIAFMAMPDAVKALLDLEAAPAGQLSQRVYNVTAFSPSAGEFYARLKDSFPDIQVTFEPHLQRQAIVDSWPEDIDDSAARADWGWQPDYDLDRALTEYLIPTITERYRTTV